MKLLIMSIFVFLIIMYVYTYKRHKKIKKNNINTVDDFRRKYRKNGIMNENQDTDEKVNNYITKYNSSIDYVEKDTFLKEASELKSKNKYQNDLK